MNLAIVVEQWKLTVRLVRLLGCYTGKVYGQGKEIALMKLEL